MRHYEIVVLIHPNQSEQAASMMERYTQQIQASGGVIHRQEDWGRRQLAYPIDKIHKAHYVLLNIECDQATLDELEHAFQFNDAIIRRLIVKQKGPITEESLMLKADKAEERREDAARRYHESRYSEDEDLEDDEDDEEDTLEDLAEDS